MTEYQRNRSGSSLAGIEYPLPRALQAQLDTIQSEGEFKEMPLVEKPVEIVEDSRIWGEEAHPIGATGARGARLVSSLIGLGTYRVGEVQTPTKNFRLSQAIGLYPATQEFCDFCDHGVASLKASAPFAFILKGSLQVPGFNLMGPQMQTLSIECMVKSWREIRFSISALRPQGPQVSGHASGSCYRHEPLQRKWLTTGLPPMPLVLLKECQGFTERL
eukprot:s50_g51.t1